MRRLTNVLAKALLALAGYAALPICAAEEPALLRIYAWSEYIPAWLLGEFQAATGARVELRTYASNEELLTRRFEAGGFDLIQPSDYVIEGLIKRNALQALDQSAIPNLKNLDPSFARLPHDPDGRYSVPWMAGTVGILYDTRRIREPIRGCGDLFAGRLTGRIAAIDDSRQLFSLALSSLGLPVNEVREENLDKAADVLESWMRQIVVFDSDTPGRLVATGDADAALVWSGEAAVLMEKHAGLAYVLPAEGAFRFVDCFCIPKGSKNKELAEKFLNFILDPTVSARVSADYPYTNPNAAAVRLLSEAQRGNVASYPAAEVRTEALRDLGAGAALLNLRYARLREKVLKND